MHTREEWFNTERIKARKFGIARNATGLGLVGLAGVQWASNLIPNVELAPTNSVVDYALIALSSLTSVAAYRLHQEKRVSESSALRAAAYEIHEKKFAGDGYIPGEWAVDALAEANLEADKVVNSGYRSIVKPKRAS
jgi:hypothetical protein